MSSASWAWARSALTNDQPGREPTGSRPQLWGGANVDLFWTAILIGVGIDLVVGIAVSALAIRHVRKRDGR